MGLFESFLAQGHTPFGDRRGHVARRKRIFCAIPDGYGWHLDRARFDGCFAGSASSAVPVLLAPRPDAIHRARWRAVAGRAGDAGQSLDLAADFVSSHTAPVATMLGARRPGAGWSGVRLPWCGTKRWRRWTDLRGRLTPDGWWYTAAGPPPCGLPYRRRSASSTATSFAGPCDEATGAVGLPNASWPEGAPRYPHHGHGSLRGRRLARCRRCCAASIPFPRRACSTHCSPAWRRRKRPTGICPDALTLCRDQ